MLTKETIEKAIALYEENTYQGDSNLRDLFSNNINDSKILMEKIAEADGGRKEAVFSDIERILRLKT